MLFTLNLSTIRTGFSFHTSIELRFYVSESIFFKLFIFAYFLGEFVNKYRKKYRGCFGINNFGKL